MILPIYYKIYVWCECAREHGFYGSRAAKYVDVTQNIKSLKELVFEEELEILFWLQHSRMFLPRALTLLRLRNSSSTADGGNLCYREIQENRKLLKEEGCSACPLLLDAADNTCGTCVDLHHRIVW